ncbi:MAG TPA: hypothetical protein VNE63_14260 [Candidatus Acidoferrales bacterium]|nr:hypothetical protein [Candidatus Acidoferrales bacterium]
MRGQIEVRVLMQREGLSGEVVNLFPSWHTGIIHGDDGYDVTFSDESLAVGFDYREVFVGLRVSYGVFFAAGVKVPAAINVLPDRTAPACESDNPEDSVTPRLVG